MPKVKSNGIEIEYESLGNPGDRPIVLIMGLGMHLIGWPDGFCKLLTDRGYRLIRFDNRDMGLSSKIDAAGVPKIFGVMNDVAEGKQPVVPYLIRDMAADTAGLMDALNIPAAHIVGVSMGGMIAQALTIEYPHKVRSLISIMSTTGRADLPPPEQEVLVEMMKLPKEREAAIQQMMILERVLTGPVFPFEEERSRDYSTRAHDRCYHRPGFARQFAAIIASPSRCDALKSIKTPALVIHGNRDPLVNIEGGKDAARCIPGARFLEIDGMGHYLSTQAWPAITDAIVELVREVDGI